MSKRDSRIRELDSLGHPMLRHLYRRVLWERGLRVHSDLKTWGRDELISAIVSLEDAA